MTVGIQHGPAMILAITEIVIETNDGLRRRLNPCGTGTEALAAPTYRPQMGESSACQLGGWALIAKIRSAG